jgi:integrase
MATVFKRQVDHKNKTSKWMISWYDAENERWKTVTGHTDKELSKAKGQRLELESQRRREGFTSGVREEALKPIEIHLGEYLTHLRSSGCDPNYMKQLENRIRRLLTEIGAPRLLDINAQKVESKLLEMKTTRGFEEGGKLLAPSTRNEYITSVTGFTAWALAERKMDYDPLSGLRKADVKKDDKVHPRRALTVDEQSRLLDASLRRPVAELLTVRVGKNKGKLMANVRPAVLERARLKGVNRRMAYLVAVWTGLRRSELEQLEWRDILLDIELPYIQLRADATKSGRDDAVPLHQQIIEELRAFTPDNSKPRDRVLREVPDMDVMKLDLAFAGIEYGNADIGFADLHAQRTTMNTMLASQGIDSRTRQSQLRHTDPRLTEGTYFDKMQYIRPQAEKLNEAAAIPVISAAQTLDADVNSLPDGAQLAHETRVTDGHDGALRGTDLLINYEGKFRTLDPKNLVFSPDFRTKRHDPALCDTGSFEKRAKGVEPSTFTLAT